MRLIGRGRAVASHEIAATPDAPDIPARFGQRIRELRTAGGLSQEAFAAKCALGRTCVGGIERGERNLALRNIEVVANALRIAISKLAEGL